MCSVLVLTPTMALSVAHAVRGHTQKPQLLRLAARAVPKYVSTVTVKTVSHANSARRDTRLTNYTLHARHVDVTRAITASMALSVLGAQLERSPQPHPVGVPVVRCAVNLLSPRMAVRAFSVRRAASLTPTALTVSCVPLAS